MLLRTRAAKRALALAPSVQVCTVSSTLLHRKTLVAPAVRVECKARWPVRASRKLPAPVFSFLGQLPLPHLISLDDPHYPLLRTRHSAISYLNHPHPLPASRAFSIDCLSASKRSRRPSSSSNGVAPSFARLETVSTLGLLRLHLVLQLPPTARAPYPLPPRINPPTPRSSWARAESPHQLSSSYPHLHHHHHPSLLAPHPPSPSLPG